jgi:arylsulfatase A-like enzyme
MCIQLMALDNELGAFFRELDATGIDYVVMLTADHGGTDIPERQREHGAPDALRVDPALNSGTMGEALARKLGLKAPVLFGDGAFGDIYVDRALSEADRARALAAAVSDYRRHPQVEAVFTARQIADTPLPTTPPEIWTVLQRVRAGYYAPRSGDFYVVLKRDVTPIADTSRYVATHGSVWDYDRRVPILFWRKGMSGTTVETSAETTDIMPTLASMIGVPVQAGSVDGHCLAAVPGTSCPSR